MRNMTDSPDFQKVHFFHKNDFSTLTLNAVFTPPNMKTGKNKKTRISYFSILYNISKNQNDRRRTPKILSLLEACGPGYRFTRPHPHQNIRTRSALLSVYSFKSESGFTRDAMYLNINIRGIWKRSNVHTRYTQCAKTTNVGLQEANYTYVLT